MSKEKLKVNFEEEYNDCGHAGCSGGEIHTLTILKSDGTVLQEVTGGCFGSEMYDQGGAIKIALELLGYEVELC